MMARKARVAKIYFRAFQTQLGPHQNSFCFGFGVRDSNFVNSGRESVAISFCDSIVWGFNLLPVFMELYSPVDLRLFTASLAVYTKQINFKPQTFQKVILTKYI